MPQTIFISSFDKGENAAIHAFSFNTNTGSLTATAKYTDIERPFYLAKSPDNRCLYSIDKFSEGRVAAFQIVDGNGTLKRLNDQSAGGAASCYLDVDKTGKTLVVANYSGGSIASMPIGKDGSLGEAKVVKQHGGSNIDPKRQGEPHAHCIKISPDNRFAYLADLGLDQILIYSLSPDTSTLTPHRQGFARTLPGAGPRHLTFHPTRPLMYVINELHNSVTCFDYDVTNGYLFEQGTITTLPEGYTDRTHTADIRITSNGKFLYGTNRGHDSIASYAIADNGGLSPIAIQCSGGAGPQNIAIIDDRWLLCANMPGGNVNVFQIDQDSGKLTQTDHSVSIPSPSCIVV